MHVYVHESIRALHKALGTRRYLAGNGHRRLERGYRKLGDDLQQIDNNVETRPRLQAHKGGVDLEHTAVERHEVGDRIIQQDAAARRMLQVRSQHARELHGRLALLGQARV